MRLDKHVDTLPDFYCLIFSLCFTIMIDGLLELLPIQNEKHYNNKKSYANRLYCNTKPSVYLDIHFSVKYDDISILNYALFSFNIV